MLKMVEVIKFGRLSMKSQVFNNWFFILILCLNLHAQTSSESANPFNKYQSGSGVTPLTGTASLTIPITTITGINGPSFPVALNYSSNVYLNGRASNERAPTSWVGFGWNMNFGRIICNHNETMDNGDDQYSWLTPQGSVLRIFYKDGKCFIEDSPFLKVEKIASRFPG
jgi:hypothetical protein